MHKKRNNVLLTTLTITILFIFWGITPNDWLGPYSLENVTAFMNTYILQKFGWFYSLLMTSLVVLAFYLAFSKYGSIRLGKDDDRPEFSYLTWLAMLFGAGMGIGLIFFGIAEPISHFYNPVQGDPATHESARLALRYSFFHWGLHPWALYAMAALVIAYFTFRKNKRGNISSTITPLFKNPSTSSIVSQTVDILAILAIIFGIVPTIGIGAQQISAGLSYLFPSIENTLTTQLILIAIVTVLYLLSAQTGLQRGIKHLSNANITFAGLLLLIVLVTGPTTFIMDYFTTTMGTYIQNLPSMSLSLSPFNEESAQWIQNWTIFYWGWWISWTPFVGSFIARISKGRTIREFIVGVMLAPTFVCLLWFAAFGGTSIYLELFSNAGIGNEIAAKGNEIGIFAVLQHLPLSSILILITLCLITTFFVTSADSATFIVAMQASNGRLSPSNRMKLLWGIIISVLAATLLNTGGLATLQTTAIIAAFPFSFVIILMVVSLFKELKKETVVTKSTAKPLPKLNKAK
ncbi:BCCT family transporter [Priestia taiwanensis]|uniref:Glycine/betaine ABC transporter n=1 Tax=Priestia taiwanensis TaxID=1347902 RepID=A0A917ERM7_9BACI|nr:BCCT family transporter [Priestia taiwanensis]MBM7364971.1 choline/carnitine/betaine transport [Priestia taiwanensis]GGE82112.1 glycine/betaine ABC transporter [Priestia taiwanensis]